MKQGTKVRSKDRVLNQEGTIVLVSPSGKLFTVRWEDGTESLEHGGTLTPIA